MTDISAHSRLEFGTAVNCVDGTFGEVEDILVEPRSLRVMHLVVQPVTGPGQARLVPVELVANVERGGVVQLRCTVDEARKLSTVHEVADLGAEGPPSGDKEWDVGIRQALPMPTYGAGTAVEDADIMLEYDRVPKGEIELRKASLARTADGGDAGRVKGFLVEGVQITHLVLLRGHLWRRHQLAVPAANIASMTTDAIDLNLSREQLESVPSQPVHD
jgi:uncharacterized protein YrrD